MMKQLVVVERFQNMLLKVTKRVYCLSMTDGVSAKSAKKAKDAKARLKNSIKASKILGFNWINIDKNFDDNEMDKVSLLSVIKVIEKVKEKFNEP